MASTLGSEFDQSRNTHVRDDIDREEQLVRPVSASGA